MQKGSKVLYLRSAPGNHVKFCKQELVLSLISVFDGSGRKLNQSFYSLQKCMVIERLGKDAVDA